VSGEEIEGVRPYDESATCPKCGYADIATTYDDPGCCPGPRPWHPDTHYGSGLLVRRCCRCGYTWVERPLDMKKEPK